MKKNQLFFKLLTAEIVFITILTVLTLITMVLGISPLKYGRLGLANFGVLFFLLLIELLLSIIISIILVYFNVMRIVEIKTAILFIFINYYNLFILSDKIRPQEISILYFIPLYGISILLVYFYFKRLKKKLKIIEQTSK